MNKTLFYIGLTICFVIAIYLRLDAYLINNSFFTDEVLLAENIFSRNYLGLFLPLSHYQSAPIIFLLATKFLTGFAGINELCFRFISFISSLLSVYLFYLYIIIANYPYTESLSTDFLIRDIASLPKGQYSLLLVKGTATYDKDLKTLQEWLTKNNIANESTILKSASLIKITK